MHKITQDMKYRNSIVKYAKTHGVTRTARKYNKSRSYIYYWLGRYDGSIESLACHSRRPGNHPKAHTHTEIQLIRMMRGHNPTLGLMEFWFKLRDRGYQRHYVSLYRVMRRQGLFPAEKKKCKRYTPKPYEKMSRPGERVQVDVKEVPRDCLVGKNGRKYYQYTAIDEYSRLRYLGAFEEANTYSSFIFIQNAIRWFAKQGIRVECVQTDNGFEFTKRLGKAKDDDNLTLFEQFLQLQGIHHKFIRPYTPRHNGKVERSHREDQKRLYDKAKFFSFVDFKKQLRRHNQRSNNIPMRPLSFCSPMQFLKNTVQYV
jgi:transposase